MNQTGGKVAVICPFWGQTGHAGLPRVERFVRWLSERGTAVSVLAAGPSYRVRAQPWGTLLEFPDPLGLYAGASGAASPARRPNALRRTMAYLLFVPDPTRVWAELLARDRRVVELVRGCSHVLSSNPPESLHLAGHRLANRIGAAFVMDMRDGWLDEPLRPMLGRSRLRRWLEGRQERRCVIGADRVLVTSEVWRERLLARLPQAQGRVHVVTNAYPPSEELAALRAGAGGRLPLIVHGGRFQGSDPRRRPGLALEPLLAAIEARGAPWRGEVRLPGRHEPAELEEIETYRERFQRHGWEVGSAEPVSRQALLELLHRAAGLLLLSTSRSQLPGKLFEYLPTGRPVLAVVPRPSATWTLCEPLEQVFLVDADAGRSEAATVVVRRFLEACEASSAFLAPEAYSDERVRARFLKALELTTGAQADQSS